MKIGFESPNFLNKSDVDHLWSSEFVAHRSRLAKTYPYSFYRCADSHAISRARLSDIEHYLPDDILCKVDIAAMMHGLETRTPLADVQVAELARRIPAEAMCEYDSDGRSFRGKIPIRNILERQFSSEFINRPKMGFGIPLPRWLFGTKKCRDELRDRLLSQDSTKVLGYLQKKGIEDILDRKRPYATWILLVLEEWLQTK